MIASPCAKIRHGTDENLFLPSKVVKGANPYDSNLASGGQRPNTSSGEAQHLHLASAKEDARPLFLAVGFHKPHIPLKFPKEFSRLYPLESIALPLMRRKPEAMPQVAWNPWNDLRRRDDVKDANPEFPYGEILPEDFQRRIRLV